MTGENYLDRVRAIRESVGPSANYARHNGIYFFLSLDLVNSTAYKAENPDWKLLIRSFYDEARNYFQNHSTGVSPVVWKYAGDEVLFYLRIRSVGDLESAVRASYAALRHIGDTVESWTDKTRPRLHVKGTCWAAEVEYQAPSSLDEARRDPAKVGRNIVFQSPMGDPGTRAVLDFLGPDIDGGFRATGTSHKRALVVSAELAGLLHARAPRDFGNGLRLVAFRELKGVWEGRHYPVIWFRDDWSATALDNDYDYDDRLKSEILSKACEAHPNSMEKLKAVLAQAGRTWLVDAALPAETTATVVPDDVEQTLGATLEVHCVAVCVSSEGQVLVAKRLPSKKVHPDKWEFGCAGLKPGDDFASAVRRDYKADFGIDLLVDEPAPVLATYSFEKDGKLIPGVILAATVAGTPTLVHPKHADAHWVSCDPPPADLSTSNCVPNLLERLTDAARWWRSKQQPR